MAIGVNLRNHGLSSRASHVNQTLATNVGLAIVPGFSEQEIVLNQPRRFSDWSAAGARMCKWSGDVKGRAGRVVNVRNSLSEEMTDRQVRGGTSEYSG